MMKIAILAMPYQMINGQQDRIKFHKLKCLVHACMGHFGFKRDINYVIGQLRNKVEKLIYELSMR